MARVLLLFLADGLYMQMYKRWQYYRPKAQEDGSAVEGIRHSSLACVGRALTAPRLTDLAACVPWDSRHAGRHILAA